MKKVEEEILVFCDNVKSIRKQNKISKKCMAEIMEISVKDLSEIESGSIPDDIGVEVVFNLAMHFNIELHKLFTIADQEDKNI